MKTIKVKSLHVVNYLLTTLLSIFGFTACLGPVEYGCPYGEFQVQGTVTNSQNEPIPDIEISIKGDYNKVKSDSTGKYTLSTYFLGETGLVIAQDIDSTDNGSYENDSILVETHYTEGDGKWYVGHDSQEINFVLKEKQK
ncbi:MAG: radical SAM-associated putative lipoprotein [Prevotellaceae bacterium]|nr:radical SAM-associated putative lipoprotein [Prevotellaceae bacterium]